MIEMTQCPRCRCYQWALIGPGELEGDWTMTCFVCGPVRWRVEVRLLPDVELPALPSARPKKAA